jgi:uncharacterized protein YcsI (UPF0317 family)
MNVKTMPPKQMRELIRKGQFDQPTSGVCLGYAQANLVMIPKAYAYDFLLFAQRNPKPCPVLAVSDPGASSIAIGEGADLYTDLGRYRIYRDGELTEERAEVSDYKDQGLVAFLLGCSFSFESELLAAGIPLRHIDRQKNVAMYDTTIPLEGSGVFEGNTVVSMRPIKGRDVARAVEITARLSKVHGSPIHVGSPEAIGIQHIEEPDYGEFVPILEDEIPVFWACGVTPQNVLRRSKIPFAITHAPGFMFITDIRNIDLLD